MNFGPNLVHLGPVVLREENAFQQISDSKTLCYQLYKSFIQRIALINLQTTGAR